VHRTTLDVVVMDFWGIGARAYSIGTIFSSSSNATGNVFSEGEPSNDWFGLSFKKRVIGFILCVLLGLIFCFLSSMFFLSPRQFAKFYTLGSMFLFGSTLFLVGPKKQFQNMFSSKRYISTLIYLASMIGTLYAALVVKQKLLILILVAIQFASVIWYGASYIPFGQDCLKSSVSSCLPV